RLGSAIVGRPVRRRAAVRRVIVHVTNDDEVEPAVAVKIEKGGRRAPGRNVEPGLLGRVAEGTVALVEKELDPVVLRYEDVQKAVVVDVADGDSHVVAVDIES